MTSAKCRAIRANYGWPPGADFQSDLGVLLYSGDGGDSWTRVDMGVRPPHTMFKLAFDERQPSRLSCATNGGDVYSSLDGGESWTVRPPPPGGTRSTPLRAADER